VVPRYRLPCTSLFQKIPEMAKAPYPIQDVLIARGGTGDFNFPWKTYTCVGAINRFVPGDTITPSNILLKIPVQNTGNRFLVYAVIANGGANYGEVISIRGVTSDGKDTINTCAIYSPVNTTGSSLPVSYSRGMPVLATAPGGSLFFCPRVQGMSESIPYQSLKFAIGLLFAPPDSMSTIQLSPIVLQGPLDFIQIACADPVQPFTAGATTNGYICACVVSDYTYPL